MKKGFVLTLTFLLAFTLLTACDSKEQKKKNEENVARAKVNAVNYVQEKYGFRGEIISAVLERNGGMFGSVPLTTVGVEMKYQGREFLVYIDGETENTHGYDNYQYQEMEAALKEEINDSIRGVRRLHISGGKGQNIGKYLKEKYEKCDNLYHTLFNGQNFAEVLGEENGRCRVVADYVQTDFEAIADWKFVSKYLDCKYTEFCFISYRSEEALNKCGDQLYPGYQFGIYMEAACTLKGTEKKLEHFKLGQFGDFYYCIEEGTPNEVEFYEVTPDDVSNWNEKGTSTLKIISKAYGIRSDGSLKVNIFYPKSRISNYSEATTRLGTCREQSNEKKFHLMSMEPKVVGDYLFSEYNVRNETGDRKEYYFLYISNSR